ncbi:helix-turn-helix domain-containing protein [Halobium salinum]|uniref:Helix-turn-helix domain-containing protein n=1 Tax=Halobium salinum TaxID=1364940 RepID=A0ABD5PBN7_9EURY|nr:helix-turn-helix domain-containing protein [Halobium salinum]
MKHVAFSVTYPPESAHPVHQGLMREEVLSRAELLVWGPTDQVTTLVWYDGDRESVRRVLDGVDSLVEASLVPGDGGTYAFTHQTAFELPAAVVDLVARAKLAFLPPVTFLDDGTARFEAVGESRSLSEFHVRLSDLLGARIERVREFDRAPSAATLTERQRAALEAAAAVGYYDVPRTGSVADVAERLDCARSTAGELLRKAESAVVFDVLDGLDGHNDLDGGAV